MIRVIFMRSIYILLKIALQVFQLTLRFYSFSFFCLIDLAPYPRDLVKQSQGSFVFIFSSHGVHIVTRAIPFSIINVIRNIYLIHDVNPSLPSSPCHFPTQWVKGLCHPIRCGQTLEECPQFNHLKDKEWEKVTSSTQTQSRSTQFFSLSQVYLVPNQVYLVPDQVYSYPQDRTMADSSP